MKRRRSPALPAIFMSGPWWPEDGDPSQPDTVRGVPVIERLGEAPDGGGALVRLADHRYALTGPTVVVASARKLDRHLRRRRRDLIGEQWIQEARELLRRETSHRTGPSRGGP